MDTGKDCLLVSASLPISFFLSFFPLPPLIYPSFLSLHLSYFFYVLRQTKCLQSKGKKQRSDLSASPSLSAYSEVWLPQLTLNVPSPSCLPSSSKQFLFLFWCSAKCNTGWYVLGLGTVSKGWKNTSPGKKRTINKCAWWCNIKWQSSICYF